MKSVCGQYSVLVLVYAPDTSLDQVYLTPTENASISFKTELGEDLKVLLPSETSLGLKMSFPAHANSHHCSVAARRAVQGGGQVYNAQFTKLSRSFGMKPVRDRRV